MQRCRCADVQRSRGAELKSCRYGDAFIKVGGQEAKRCNDAVADTGTEVQIKVLSAEVKR